MTKVKNTRGGLFRALSLMGAWFWPYFGATVVFSAIIAFNFNIVLAFLMKDVLDAALSGESEFIIRAVILAAATFLIGVPILQVTRYGAAIYIKKTMTKLRMSLFTHLVSLSISDLDQQHSGDLISRSTNDLETIEGIYWNQLQTFLMAIFMGVASITAIYILDWRMGMVALILGGVTLITSAAFTKPLKRKSETIQSSIGVLTERLTDLLQGLPVTKMFHLQEPIHALYANANQEVAEATVDHSRIEAIYEALNNLIGWLRYIGSLIFGLFLLSRGTLVLSVLWAIIHLQNNASFLFGNLTSFNTGLQRSLAGADRVFELLDRPAEPEGSSTVASQALLSTSQADSMIELQNVSFGYESNNANGAGEKTAVETEDEPQKAVAVLQEINLSVAQGQVAALVGPSGSGKSTIIKLLLGLYPAQEGQLSIGGKPLDQIPLAQIRDLTAYVPQDAYLFSDTIEENIRYGRPEATKEEIIAAAQAANAHDFIMERSEGYDTLVGERGAAFSGGQRQRIAIARALLKDAPILLLDEATSALDSESERQVQEALQVLMKGRTTIAIAHRLSTIEHADAIYVLDKGKVVERGRHEELLAQGGLYANLHKLQFRQVTSAR